MKPCLRVPAFMCLATVLIATVVSATQVTYMSPQDLGQQSELVFRGKVVGVDSYWNSKHTKIFTRARIAADETYKGDSRSIVDVIQIGGTVGNVKVTVQGALQWTPGEEVLLFAEPYDGFTYQVSGFSQGKFSIKHDARTGAAYIQAPSMEGVSLLGAPSQAGPMTEATEKIPLERFVNQALGRR